MASKLILRGRDKTRLLLFDARIEAGELTAQGYQTSKLLRKNRIFTDDIKQIYRLTETLEPGELDGVRVVPLTLSAPITLEVVHD